MNRLTKAGVFLAALLLTAGAALASQCVTCHVDAEKLEAITKTLPAKATSSETAGKG